MLLILFPSIILASAVSLPSCSSIARKPQKHPPQYKNDIFSSWEAHETSHMSEANAQIPTVCDEAIRIVSYNVKRMVNTVERISGIVDEIKAIQPTILILGKMAASGEGRQLLDSLLEAEGFKYRGEKFGASRIDVIFSRLPLTDIKVNDYTLKATVGEGSEAINLYAAHLTKTGKGDFEGKAKSIVKEMAVDGRNLLAICLDGKDPKSAGLVFYRNGLFDSFAALKWPAPTYTSSKGDRIDFIRLSDQVKHQLMGTYIYHTITSGRLPVIVDVRMSKEAQARAVQMKHEVQVKPSKLESWIRMLFVIAILVMINLVGFLIFLGIRHFWRKWKSTPS